MSATSELPSVTAVPQLESPGLALTVIEPPRGWQWLNFGELWRQRELLYFFTWRDTKVRYKQTLLGAAWAVLQPVAMATIFTLVLSRTTDTDALLVPYPVFVFCGLIAWNLFATSLGMAANSLVESERLITKIYFPRLLIPLATLGPALVDFAISCAVFVALMLAYGLVPSWTIIFAPLPLVVLVAAVVGMGTLLSALNVTYRDFRYATTFLLQAWMFATPAIYVSSFAQPLHQNPLTTDWSSLSTWFVLANPLNGSIAFFRAAVTGLPLPWLLLGVSAAISLLMLVVGLAYFRRAEDSFADLIQDLAVPPAIRVENLSKRYRIQHGDGAAYRTLRDEIMRAAGAPLRWLRGESTSRQEDFWALRDVSFEVQPGEVVGVIGRNGAGKSTLLKILSRITKPTQGRVEMRGRVSSLLEVGTGFHPELTGRENIFLSGAILGMQRTEIARKFDEIVAFAEIERFLDTPVKRYSSGMYVRLAFSVAAHLEPDILIIDEVLAVGDAAFQKKCLGKLGNVASSGRTVAFVTHNMTAARSLCQQGIWLDGGAVVQSGPIARVASLYLQRQDESTPSACWQTPQQAPGNDCVRLHKISVSDSSGSADELLTVDTELNVEIAYWTLVDDQSLHISWLLYNEDDIIVFNVGTQPQRFPVGLVTSTCTIPRMFLNDGLYRVRLHVFKDGIKPQFDVRDVVTFSIEDTARSEGWMQKALGVVRPDFDWRTSVISDTVAGVPS